MRSLRQGCHKIQGDIYKQLKDAYPGKDLLSLVQQRILLHAGIPDAPVEIWADRLRHSREHFKWCNVKTWLGGWTTSRRMHEASALQCVFGCYNCEDAWTHYVKCSGCWYYAFESVHVPIISNLSERLHFLMMTDIGLKIVCIAFKAYHEIKSSTIANKQVLNYDRIASVFSASAMQLRGM